MICGFFKGNEVSPESNISIDTRHIIQQICVARRSFGFILSIFIHEFLEYTFEMKVGRRKRKERKRTWQNLPKRQKLPNVRKALYSILVLTFLYLTNHNARTNLNEPIGSRNEYM